MQESLSHRPSPQLSSVGKTFGNIVVSIVGAGVLGLPYAFKHTGWLLTSLVLTSVGFLSYYCMLLLVRCRKRLEKEADLQIDCFSDVGFLMYGKLGRLFVDSMMVLSQGAFCIAYLIFIGENLASVFNTSIRSSENKPELLADPVAAARRSLAEDEANFLASKEVYIWIIFPFEVMLASIRSLTNLAPFSIFADMTNGIAMTVVMHQDAMAFTRNGIASVVGSRGLSTIPFAVGVSIYAFEGFGLVLPLESAMKERKKFEGVLATAMACITLLYMVFGMLGYLAFGEETCDIITLNLGSSRRTAVMVKLCLCMGLFLSLPVMMYPVYEVLERRLVRGKRSMMVRGLAALGAAWCAAAVPQFGVFLSLMGNSVCCILAFILPALFHIKSHGSDLSKTALGIDCLIISFGVVYGVWGTVCALHDLLAAH